jgi:hypothetical protein
MVKLYEMFSPIGAPSEPDQDINWLDDLKFFIDNDNAMLNQYFFPAIKKHKQHRGHPNAFKIYMRPLESCLESYCDKYEVENYEEKFPKDKMIELAKQIADQQEKFMEEGDYDQ